MMEAHADTIVLKNGRRISVSVAKETVDRVTGETDAGQISLPKSMVERIEHGSFDIPTSANRNNTSGTNTSEIRESAKSIGLATVAQPVFFFFFSIVRATFYDGFIDFFFFSFVVLAALGCIPCRISRAE